MNAITENILREAADAFAFDRTTGEISRYGEGHINDTFVVWASDKCKRYIMQRINTDTFKNPKELMENVCNVTSFLRKVILENGGDPERETLNVIPTKEGNLSILIATAAHGELISSSRILSVCKKSKTKMIFTL